MNSDPSIIDVVVAGEQRGQLYEMWLEDSFTGRIISPEETLRRFANLTITGVYVRRRPGIPESFPPLGQITDITQNEVILDDKHKVSRHSFGALYELD